MLTGFRLSLRRLPDGRLLFTIPPVQRLLLFGIGMVILASLFITAPERPGSIFVAANTVPLIVCLVSFLGSVYRERWIFDRTNDRFVHQCGLSFVHLGWRGRISELRRIELSQFVKGRLGTDEAPGRMFFLRPVLILSLQTEGGTVYRLETYGASQRRRIETTARAIAEYCRIPVEDRLPPSPG